MSKFLAVGLLVLSVGAASAQATREAPPPPADPTIEQVPAAMADWFGKTVNKIVDPDEPDAAGPAVPEKHHHHTEPN